MFKIVAIQDEHGNQQRFVGSQIKALQLNRWKGWQCSLGQHVVHITLDGDVYGGTCRVGGKLGDIYTGWKTLPEWITCTASNCNCGTQIKIPKFKPGYQDALEANQFPENGPIDGDKQVFVDHVGPIDLNIQWDLGRFCNYDCSYCLGGEKGIHNTYEPHKPIDVLIRTVDRFHEQYAGRVMMFNFAGGEPTAHPQFVDLCKHIKSLGHKIHLTTNGSHGPRYWKSLVPFMDYVMISVHFEFASIPLLVKNLKVLLDYQKDVNPILHLGIHIMTKPEDWDKSQELIALMRDLDPDFYRKVETHMTPLRVMLGKIQDLMDYTPEQIAGFGLVE